MKLKPFLVRALICLALSLIPLHELENQIYSARLAFRGHHSEIKNVVVFNWEAQDFSTLKNISRFGETDSQGKPWIDPQEKPELSQKQSDRLEGLRELFYWDPHLYRELLRRLLALDPKLVIVTWFIPGEVISSLTDPGIELLAKNKKIVWSTQINADGKYLRPPKAFLGGLEDQLHFGINNLLEDSDGIIRKGIFARQNHLSLAGVAELVLGKKTKTNQNTFLINFAGPEGSVPLCSLGDFLLHRSQLQAVSPWCTELKDKIVILARDSKAGSMDPLAKSLSGSFYKTPLGDISRAEILANELHTTVGGHGLYQASFIEQLILIVLMLSLSAYIIVNYPVHISAILISLGGFLLLGPVFQFLFSYTDIYIPSANIGFAMLVTYLVFTGYRLAFQENIQWRSLKQAQYLRELDQMKTNFLTLVSHDLKTPLAKIQAVSDRLRRESNLNTEERSDWNELFDTLDSSNLELRNYITSILNFSKIESQKVILNKKSNDINTVISLATKRLLNLAKSKNITIEEKLEPLFSFEFDEDLIRQVLSNLIDNAIKYSPENSKVIVSSSEIDGFVKVDIQDFGLGIPKDKLPLVFKKFSRFLRPMNEQVKGTGLGLYLSKYFIELHGGQISFETEENKGTTFSFTLPLLGSENQNILS